jgi:hypothetical protein
MPLQRSPRSIRTPVTLRSHQRTVRRYPHPLSNWALRNWTRSPNAWPGLYEAGALVSIDKLSRIPPLDAPLDPSLFGDASALQRGNVTRKVINACFAD